MKVCNGCNRRCHFTTLFLALLSSLFSISKLVKLVKEMFLSIRWPFMHTCNTLSTKVSRKPPKSRIPSYLKKQKMTFYNDILGFKRCCISVRMWISEAVNNKNLLLSICGNEEFLNLKLWILRAVKFVIYWCWNMHPYWYTASLEAKNKILKWQLKKSSNVQLVSHVHASLNFEMALGQYFFAWFFPLPGNVTALFRRSRFLKYSLSNFWIYFPW